MAAARARHRGAFLTAAAVVVALDQVTKHWAVNALADGPIDLIGSLRLALTFNDSAAFSIGGGRTTLITVLGLCVATALVVMGLREERRGWAIGLGIIMGGALGNLTDRLLRDGDGILGGHVVDMIDVQWWPVFNVADAALWVGIGVLVVCSREPRRQAEHLPR